MNECGEHSPYFYLEAKEQRRISDRIQVMSTVAEEPEDSREDVSDFAATASVPVQSAPQPKVSVPQFSQSWEIPTRAWMGQIRLRTKKITRS